MRLELELRRNDLGVPTGTVGTPGGQQHPFTGVMELVAVLERLLEHGDCAIDPAAWAPRS